jgi:hypothetical protein
MKSLTLDPSNASAHRFLSDVYATQPRRDIARASELLQSQLLQDININPVQPSIVETDLNIVTQGGPATPGFNEYNSLFERNRLQLDLSGIVGTEWTRGEEAVVSGVYNRYSLSAGQFHYQSDGFRQNFDIHHDIYDVFGQAAITPELNVQAEYRRRSTEEGDLEIDFDPDDFSGNQHRDIDQDAGRIGARYSPTPESDFIASFIYSRRNEKQKDSFRIDTILTLDTDDRFHQKSYQGEAQYLLHTHSADFITGMASYRVDTRFESFQFTEFGPEPDIIEDISTTQNTAYAYSNISLPPDLTATLGDYKQEGTDLLT